MSIDGTDFWINKPRPFDRDQNKFWFSPNFHGPGLRYEVGITIHTGDIVWFNGPYPCGWGPDLKIFNQCLKLLLKPLEKIMADRNYKPSSKPYTKESVDKYFLGPSKVKLQSIELLLEF